MAKPTIRPRARGLPVPSTFHGKRSWALLPTSPLSQREPAPSHQRTQKCRAWESPRYPRRPLRWWHPNQPRLPGAPTADCRRAPSADPRPKASHDSRDRTGGHRFHGKPTLPPQGSERCRECHPTRFCPAFEARCAPGPLRRRLLWRRSPCRLVRPQRATPLFHGKRHPRLCLAMVHRPRVPAPHARKATPSRTSRRRYRRGHPRLLRASPRRREPAHQPPGR